MNNKLLINKKIGLVTGASSEIGLAVVEKLVSMGFFVFAQYNNNQPEVKQELIEHVKFFKVNFLFDQELTSFTQLLELEAPHLDVVVNCASLHEKYLLSDQDDYSIFQKVSKVNMFTPLFIIKRLHKKMSERESSSVIFISSFYSRGKGSLSNIYYAITKTALLTMSRVLAIEHSPVRSNIIVPGYVDTRTYRKGRVEEDIEKDIKNSLNKHLVPVLDIVKTVEFIIENKSLNASEIKVDGGLYI